LISSKVTDDEYRDLLEWICNLETGPWAAGGSARKVWQGKPWMSQDVDLFFRDQQQYDAVTEMLSHLGQSQKVIHNTDNAITYKIYMHSGDEIKIQTVRKRWYADIQAVVDDFDFGVAQFASDGVTVLATEQAIQDCADNRIRMTSRSANRSKLLRLLKYTAYGFDPDDELFIKTVTTISSGDLNDFGY
jgi:hypothetical protein